jgi:very-short-patch-repair endonuclease
MRLAPVTRPSRDGDSPAAQRRKRLERLQRLRRADQLAAEQGGVVSRRQLYRLELTRGEVRAQLRAGRWQRVGDGVIALHNGDVSEEGHLWSAVLHGGRHAMLDGEAALVASGLKRWTMDQIRVSVPKGGVGRRIGRYDIRCTRRWSATNRAPSGIPRVRPEIGAVHGALWAKTDRQATYLVTVTVQQGLTRPEDLGRALLTIKRDRRRTLLHQVVNDLLDGGRSLGELDVVRELRRRGLPPPAQQSLRKDKRGRYYLDLSWPDLHLVVEVDGIHHAWTENVVGDALRQNSLAMAGDTVLRVPLLGLRLCADDFYDQIEQAIRAAQTAALAA